MAYNYNRTATDKPLATFTNDEDQMESYVVANRDPHYPGTFNVVMRDLDSGDMVPAGFVRVPTMHEAFAMA